MAWLSRAVLLILVCAGTGWGRQLQAPARFSLSVGAGYDRGEFGTAEASKALYAPVSLRYTADRFDIAVSSAWARIETPGGVRFIDGVPTFVESAEGVALREAGIGDTAIRGRVHIFNDVASDTSLPSIAPFVRLKIPTGAEEKGLGTGRPDAGFGIEVDKDLGSVFLFGDVSYTVVGKIAGLDLQNRTAGGFGMARQLAESVTVSGMLDWRRAIVPGNPNPAELVGVFSYRINPALSWSPHVFFGLTDGSPNFGAGVQMNYRFGRF